MVFTSDSTENYAGFTASAKPYVACAGLVTLMTSSASISSGTSPYSSYRTCAWIIAPPRAISIILTFSGFETELGYDFVRVYSCTTETCTSFAELAGSPFSGNLVPGAVICNSGFMKVVFTSSYIQNYAGFTASSTACLVSCESGYTCCNTCGVWSCELCDRGTFKSSSGAGVCLSCEAGKSASTSAATACALCAVGTYKSSIGHVACYDSQHCLTANACRSCEAGKYASAQAASVCALCAVGTYKRSSGAGACLACEIGRYAPAQAASVCALCAVGTYKSSIGAGACLACEIGRYASAQAASVCALCAVGTYGNSSGAGACLACEAGQSSSIASTACAVCEVGTYKKSSGAGGCLSCEAGQYGPAQGATACTLCSAGTFKTSLGSRPCSPCPSGSNSSGGSTAPTMCTCMAGYGIEYGYLPPASEAGYGYACSAPGQVLTSDRGRLCRYQYASNQDVSWIIAVDDASSAVAVVLTELDTGRGYDVVYVDGCSDTSCSDAWGIVEWSGTLDLFSIGSADRMDAVGRVIRVNFVSDGAVTRPGWSLTWQRVSARCVQCGPDSFGLAEAEDLGSNLFFGSIGSDQVTPAVAPCVPCPPRTTSPPGAGSESSCLCAPGTAGTTARSFLDTDIGECAQMTRALGSNGVLTAPNGCVIAKFSVGYLWTAAAAWIVVAPPRPSSVMLRVVALNTGNNGAVTVAACADSACASPVTLGEFSGTVIPDRAIWAADGPVRIELAVRDLYHYSQQIVGFSVAWSTLPGACRACEPGTYSGAAGGAACTSCRPGTFAAAAGAVGCAQCARGMHTRTAGAMVCLACGAGTYSQALEATACSMCAGGTYSTALSSTTMGECGTCPAGSWAGTGASSCNLCPTGSAAGAAGSAECVACPAGSFTPGPGSTACALCVTGDTLCSRLPGAVSTAAAGLYFLVTLPMRLDAFLGLQGQYRLAVAEAAAVPLDNVTVVSAVERRAGQRLLQVGASAVVVRTLVSAQASRAAVVRLAVVNVSALGDRLAAHGLPRPSSNSESVAPSSTPVQQTSLDTGPPAAVAPARASATLEAVGGTFKLTVVIASLVVVVASTSFR